MKKRHISIATILAIVLYMGISSSCNREQRSYAEKLRAEEKAIRRFMRDSSFIVIKDLPKNLKFKTNEFYRLPNGVYMNVIEPGGEKATNNTQIFIRFRAEQFHTSIVVYDNISAIGTSQTNPIQIVYLKSGYQRPFYRLVNSSMNHNFDFLMSEGMIAPLEYVGDGAKVKVIVPFKLNNSDLLTEGEPLYFSILKYKFVQ